MNTEFSVSMCVYGKDNPLWFQIAIDSVLNQSVKPSEVVLVVDGPVPYELEKVITRYESNPIMKVIRLATNQGHGIARRTGLAACSNELVAIMDADDISDYNRFRKQIEAFQSNPNIDVVGGQISEFIDDVTNVIGKRIVPTEDEEIKEFLKLRCPMNLTTVMLKKKSVEKVGGFLDWYCDEDYYLWIRMFLNHMIFHNVDDVLVNVRVGKDMYKRRGGKRYFKSEAKLQKYMLENKVITPYIYVVNVLKRFIVQVLLPNNIRGLVFKVLARE